MSPCWGSCLQCFGRLSQNKCSCWIVCDDLGSSAGQASGSLTPVILGTGLWESKRHIQWVRPWLRPLPLWWDLFSFTGVQSLQSLDPYSDRRVGWILGSGEGQACNQLSLSWWQHMGPTPPRNILWRLASLPPRTQDFFFDFISLSQPCMACATEDQS